MADSEYDDDHYYVWDNQVRFAETDAQSVVFYGTYATYMDETFSEYLRQIGYDYHELEDAGWDIHVVHLDLDYRAPAAFDDWLTNGLRVDRIGDSAIDFSYVCRQRDGGELVAEGGLTHVAVDGDGDPTRVPDGFREAVSDFQDEPPGGAE